MLWVWFGSDRGILIGQIRNDVGTGRKKKHGHEPTFKFRYGRRLAFLEWFKWVGSYFHTARQPLTLTLTYLAVLFWWDGSILVMSSIKDFEFTISHSWMGNQLVRDYNIVPIKVVSTPLPIANAHTNYVSRVSPNKSTILQDEVRPLQFQQ